MIIPGSANPLLLATAAAAAAETFQISRSLRFDSGSTSSLTKTFSSNGDRQKWTFSFWIKRSKLGTKQQIFGCQGTSDGDYSEMYFDTDDKLFIRFGYTSVVDAKPAAVFRDVSAWYHIVIALDTQNSTENHRLRVYVNGTELDDYSDDSRSSFTGTYGIGRAGAHKISGEPNGSGSHIDGYMTEIHYVNGSQKAPTDFGVLDSNNNWNPKEYSGTHGTNGFYLKCADNTSNASLGTDSSGNNNTFTVTNLIATAGLETAPQGFDVVTYTGNGGAQAIGGPVYSTGVSAYLNSLGSEPATNLFDGNTSTSFYSSSTSGSGIKFVPATAITGSIELYLRNGDTDNSTFSYSLDGGSTFTNLTTTGGSGSYVSIGSQTISTTNGIIVRHVTTDGTNSVNWRAIKVDGAVLADGDGSNPLGFQPDLVWVKNRDESVSHFLYDAVRGANKYLRTDTLNAQDTGSSNELSFNSDGFTVSGAGGGVNKNNVDFVAWAWRANGAGSALNTGSIPATVSVNNTYGFSIVKYEGTGANGTVAHGLSTAPKFFFGRNIDDTTNSRDWIIYHESIGNTGRLKFTSGTTSTSSTFFQDTSPSDSLITIGTSNDINKDNDDYILYCWTEIAGFSKFGSFSHASTTSLTLGFKPKFFLIKETDGSTPWYLFDAERDSFDDPLFPSTNGSEANGFAFTAADDGISWVSGSLNAGTYIYAAFADKPNGAIIDSLIDTPTNADADSGNNIGNYCTWNPLAREASRFTFANGNLNVSGNAQNYGVSGTLFVGGSGKYYFELTSNSSVTYPIVGIVSAEAVANDMVDGSIANGLELGGPVYGFMPGYGPRILTQTTTTTWSGVSQSTPTSGDVYGVAVDFDNGAIYFSKNGEFLNSGDPTSGSTKTGAAFTSISAGDYTVLLHDLGSSDSIDFDLNAGQRGFSYTPPTGYVSLCTQNLPDPDIDDGSTIFDAKTWVGTGATRNITDYGFSPDWVWIKQTNATRSHNVFDTVRTAGKPLFIDLQNNELSDGRLTGFLSNGFTLDSDNAVNDSSPAAYVGYAWKAGATTVSNTDGSGPTNVEVRASQTNGFSIVKYTGNGSSGTVGHGLSVPPEWIVIKNRDASSHWHVYHVGLTSGKRLNFSNNEKEFTPGTAGITTVSNTTFTLGSSRAETNADGNDYIAYCWSPVSQFSVFGKYIGNNSDNGPYVFTGMRPRFILFKRIDADSNWRVHDTAREDYNPHDTLIFPDQNDQALANSGYKVDILSNGFKIRNTNSNFNASGGEYIYCAFAEHPFKTSRAR